MMINGKNLKSLRDDVIKGYTPGVGTILWLIDQALACESMHDDEQIENEHASFKMMRGLVIGSVISLVAQYYVFKWLFLNSGWF